MQKKNKEQEKEVKIKYDIFLKRLHKIVKFKGTDMAEINCELCGIRTPLSTFTTFMYPNYSIKALCNLCGKKEFIRVDYRNKN